MGCSRSRSPCWRSPSTSPSTCMGKPRRGAVGPAAGPLGLPDGEGDGTPGLGAGDRPAAVGDDALAAVGADRTAPARRPLRVLAVRAVLPGSPDFTGGSRAG